MFGYISFKVRILLGFLAIISLMIGIVAVGLLSFSQTQGDVAKVDDTYLPNALLAERMAVYTVQLQQMLTQASISQDPDSFQDAERGLKTSSRALRSSASVCRQISGQIRDLFSLAKVQL
jgi:hypothetical protein